MLTLVTSLLMATPAFAMDRAQMIDLVRSIENHLVTTELNPSEAFALSAELADVHEKVSGAAHAPAVLTISDGASYNFGTLNAGEQIEHVFTVTNVGGTGASRVTASGVTAPFAFKAGAYPGYGGTCTDVLAAGTSCTLVFVFAPTEGGFSNDMVNLSYFDGRSDQSAVRGISGVANPPRE